MPDVAGPGNSTSSARPHPPSTAGLEPESAAAHRVGWGFISLYGKLSDRTSSRLGMRRPWMVIGLALYAVAGVWAIIGALAILPVRGVR
jgi:hypothetical protein